ncbi:hypothetical protein CC78DRAFT_535284 [Lojkania enalia]|uniref:Uncharacterized protein n=1 Tax=Lojkania enalia TaxID=147567 RepID=A0A9P4N1U5_9PLEO|nr:hypothetical protein CC78DRAFT_535284 [Didymosphaeria enalia]
MSPELGRANGVAASELKTLTVVPAASKQGLNEDEENIGTWLCEKGPYQKYIAALSKFNPGLKSPDPANKKHVTPKPNNATVVLLETENNGKPNFKKEQFKNLAKLKEHFDTTGKEHDKRRVYIMEGLAPEYVSVIGGHFFMDPSFFQRQERTCVWSNEFTPTSDALPQPSLLNPDKTFQIQYCELRHFKENMSNFPYFCTRTGRHVGMTNPRASEGFEGSTTGILRRKLGFWCRKTGNSGWDAIILCDPQLFEVVKPGGKPRETKNEAFQDGYIDFVPPPSHEAVLSGTVKDHPHESMLKDLCHYFENYSAALTSADWPDPWANPTTASFFMKKIVTAHSLQLVDYIKAMLPSLELHLTTAWVDEQDQWKSLQTISRRCGNYRDDMEDTLLSLGYPLKEPDSKSVRQWTDCEKDFQYIYFRLGVLKSRADTLMQAMTGLASIAGNRQNLEEAKRVKRLNLLALLFIPLAYTSSLFSMQDKYAPGENQFWIYWASAVPAIAFTFFATWVLDSALDDAAQWKGWWRIWEKVRDLGKGKKGPVMRAPLKRGGRSMTIYGGRQ